MLTWLSRMKRIILRLLKRQQITGLEFHLWQNVSELEWPSTGCKNWANTYHQPNTGKILTAAGKIIFFTLAGIFKINIQGKYSRAIQSMHSVNKNLLNKTRHKVLHRLLWWFYIQLWQSSTLELITAGQHGTVIIMIIIHYHYCN